MNILVTGSTGFLGKHVVDRLQNYHNVYTVSTTPPKDSSPSVKRNGGRHNRHYAIDLSQEKHVLFMFEDLDMLGVKIDAIVHLAAIATPQVDNDNPSKIIDVNIKATNNLLHYCDEGTNFVFASSIVVYGDQTNPTVQTPHAPTTVYGATKSACESLICAYQSQGKINSHICRLGATVGSGLTHGILFDFIRKIKNDPVLECWGNYPGSSKVFTHVDDVVDKIVAKTNNNVNSSLENVCNGDHINVKQVAETTMLALDIQKEIVFTGSNFAGDNPILSAQPPIGNSFKYPTSKQAIYQAVKDQEC